MTLREQCLHDSPHKLSRKNASSNKSHTALWLLVEVFVSWCMLKKNILRLIYFLYLFHLFLRCYMIFIVDISMSQVRFVPRYFIFVEVVVLLMYFSVGSLLPGFSILKLNLPTLLNFLSVNVFC